MAVPALALTPASPLDILEKAMHSSRSEWIFLRELRVGTGRRNGDAQRLDAFALNSLPYTGMKRICYEVKVSRADFLCEIKRPLKRRIGMRYSNEFYFVTPPSLIDVSELPAECGLDRSRPCEPGRMERTDPTSIRILPLRSRYPSLLYDHRSGALAGYPGANLAARCSDDAQPAP